MASIAGLVAGAVVATPSENPGPAAALDTARIERLTGVKGELDPSEPGVFKGSVPRSDLTVTAAGVHLTPTMGLTSWAAFNRAGDQTVVVGDTVMLEDQVNPVLSAALENGREVTALHNHVFWDSPRVMFMHIGGTGGKAKLVAAVGKVFAKIKETSGGKGRLADGVYKITIGRSQDLARGVKAALDQTRPDAR